MRVKRIETTTYAAVFADGTPASPEYLDIETAKARAHDVGAGHIRTTCTTITETVQENKKAKKR